MVALSQLSPAELQQLLEDFPWFTLARREAISRQCGDDEAALRQALGRDAVFFLSRDGMFRLLTGRAAAPEEVPEEALEELPEEKTARPQYYVVGGDYFGQEDFEWLEQAGFSVTTPVFGARAGHAEYAPAVAEEVDSEKTMVTETLAEIYARQELFQRSIEIYEKLILLFPEKSAYFASLIEKIKNKKQ